MSEQARRDAALATLYRLRLLLTNGEKKEYKYTTEEIVELLDKLAMAKEQ